MLEQCTPTSDVYGFLIDAGFIPESPAYCITGRPVCTLDDLKDALFKSTRDAVVKLPIKLDEHTTLLLMVTLARPIFTLLGELNDPDNETLPDWYVEGENSAPTDQFGKRVRVYFIGQLDGIFWEPYVQTIRDEG